MSCRVNWVGLFLAVMDTLLSRLLDLLKRGFVCFVLGDLVMFKWRKRIPEYKRLQYLLLGCKL